MRDNRRDAEELHAALWSAIDNGAGTGEVAEATERYLEAGDGFSEDPEVLVAAASQLETDGRRLAEQGRADEAAQVLGVALRAAGEGGHLAMTGSLLGLREQLLVDLGRGSDRLQRRYVRLLGNEGDSGASGGGQPDSSPDPPHLFGSADQETPTAASSDWQIGHAESADVPPRPSTAARAPTAPPAPERDDSRGGGDPDVLDLRDYLTVLRRRWKAVAATLVLVVGAAMAVSLTRTPVYESTAELLVGGSSSGGGGDVLQELVLGDRELSTFSEIVDSQQVAELAAERLEGNPDPNRLADRINAELVSGTQLLRISATATEPGRAAAVAQAFADGFLAFRSQQVMEQLSRAEQRLQTRQQELQSRLSEINDRLGGGGVSSEEQASLESEKDRIQSELSGLSTQQASLSGSEEVARGGGQVMRPAQIPNEPASPQPLRTGALATVLGLMLGVGLAFLRDFLDDTVRDESQAVRAAGVGAVGHIPTWRTDETTKRRLVTLMEPTSPVSEAYRTLRTNVRYLMAGRQVSSILVTSALSGEGKTTTAGNLAVALADAGMRTLLVGADLRRPLLHDMVGIQQTPGLIEVLVGDLDSEEALCDLGIDGLRVVPAGSVPPNPAELLGSPAMADLATRFEQIADVVVYDAAPALAVADTLELSSLVGMSLLVVDIDGSGSRAVERAGDRLRGVGSDVAGVVLNNVHSDDVYYGDYYTGSE